MLEYKNQDLSKGKIFLKFGADWCGPCRSLEPVLEELEKQYKNITFIDVNVDLNADLAAEYAVRSVPYMFAIEDGNIKDQVIGADIPRINYMLETL